MATERGRGSPRNITPIEHELTLHLERAHELGERAQRANDNVQHEIDRAMEIADRLRGRMNSFER